jgi:hypothetical protein
MFKVVLLLCEIPKEKKMQGNHSKLLDDILENHTYHQAARFIKVSPSTVLNIKNGKSVSRRTVRLIIEAHKKLQK